MSTDTKTQALDHAWRWFELHAVQRLTMVRFYLAVLGALAGAIGYAYGRSWFTVAALLSVFGTVSAVSFARLDKRVSDLVKLGESALKTEQLLLAGGDETAAINICEKADKSHGRYPYTYRQNFTVLLTFAAFLFLFAFTASAASMSVGHDIFVDRKTWLDP